MSIGELSCVRVRGRCAELGSRSALPNNNELFSLVERKLYLIVAGSAAMLNHRSNSDVFSLETDLCSPLCLCGQQGKYLV